MISKTNVRNILRFLTKADTTLSMFTFNKIFFDYSYMSLHCETVLETRYKLERYMKTIWTQSYSDEEVKYQTIFFEMNKKEKMSEQFFTSCI